MVTLIGSVTKKTLFDGCISIKSNSEISKVQTSHDKTNKVT